jgi:hypothetical protein
LAKCLSNQKIMGKTQKIKNRLSKWKKRYAEKIGKNINLPP